MEYSFTNVADYVEAVNAETEQGNEGERLKRMEWTLRNIEQNQGLSLFYRKARIFATLIAERFDALSKFGNNGKYINFSSPLQIDLNGLDVPCLAIKKSVFHEDRSVVTPNINIWLSSFDSTPSSPVCDECTGRSNCPIRSVGLFNRELKAIHVELGTWDFEIEEVMPLDVQGLLAGAMGFSTERFFSEQTGETGVGANKPAAYVQGKGETVEGQIMQTIADVVSEEGYPLNGDEMYPLPKRQTATELGCTVRTLNQVVSERADCLSNEVNGFTVSADGCVGDECKYFNNCPLKQILLSKAI